MSYLEKLVRKQINENDPIELKHINNSVPEVTREVDNFKTEVLNYVEDIYQKFSDNPKKIKKYIDRVNETKHKLHELLTETNLGKDSLATAEEEFETTSTEIAMKQLQINMAKECFWIHSMVKYTQWLYNDLGYDCAMKILLDTEEKVSCSIERHPKEYPFDVLLHLKQLLIDQKNRWLAQSQEYLDKHCFFEKSGNTAMVKFSKEWDDIGMHMRVFIVNSGFEQRSIKLLDKLSEFLWENYFIPIINSKVILEESKSEDQYYNILTISIEDVNDKPNYTTVYKNLTALIDYFEKNDHSLDEDLSTVEYIGKKVKTKLCDLIIKECLEPLIPNNKKGLKEFSEVIKNTEELEKKFKCFESFQPKSLLLDYVKNIDVLFINKKCANYIGQAKNIMRRDIHDIIEIGTPFDSSRLSINLDEFLKCSISSNVKELLGLTEKIWDELNEESDENVGHLFYAFQSIFGLYPQFVSEHHQRFLQTIPQQIAIFYNNCLYLSFMLKKREKDIGTFPSLVKCGDITLQKEINQLEKIGTSSFEIFVDDQVKQIVGILKGANLDQKQSLSNVDVSTEKCIRQCLRQQELLKTVWHNVLSYLTYNTTIGKILNTMCTILISFIKKFEDIETNACEQLIDILKIVTNRGPKLFTEAKEIHLYVDTWHKFNELIFILSSSLLDINDRWADGKGLLALQYKPEELKQLIRALFQNSDRRAAVLAKIRE